MISNLQSNKSQTTFHRLADKVAIITGASRGIGAAAAKLFAQEGASVVLAARSEEAMSQVVTEIQSAGGLAVAIKTDVCEQDSVEALIKHTLETYGRLDIAFNNAGGNIGNKPFLETSAQEFDQVIAVNLKGVFLCLKYEIPAMLAGGGGAIVNTSSAVSLAGWSEIAPYVAAKHGVVGLTKSIALEFSRRNIRVNAIAPGPIRNEMREAQFLTNPNLEAQIGSAVPLGRMGTLKEVAEAALWLCSDLSSYVTGVTLPIEGGQLIP
ncbi:MAG: glucose 1-dehydrogenase [Anaerolineaceae bacterium]|nr:glucose 1-dehydrogenase [Anaerolineaceae bacterium]